MIPTLPLVVAGRRGRWIAGAALTVVAACAPVITQESAQLTPGDGRMFRLARKAEIPLSTGYSTTLRPNTRWQRVGQLPQGDVYRTRDQIVTVEGAHIHEAYVVLKDGSIVGFYLPVERTFSPVKPQPLSMEQ
jgi:hypothetical protein